MHVIAVRRYMYNATIDLSVELYVHVNDAFASANRTARIFAIIIETEIGVAFMQSEVDSAFPGCQSSNRGRRSVWKRRKKKKD